MKFVYHFGAHCTDEDRLLKCLFKSRGALADRGINVSGPGRYRPQLRAAVKELRGTPAPQAQQDALLDEILIAEGAERVIFSHSAFFSSAGGAIGMGRFYHRAGELAQGYARLFPDDDAEFFFAIRDPASFIPALFAQSGEADFQNFLMGLEPMTMRWSETITRIRRSAPNVPLTVWCNEDSPVIWHDILNRMVGIDPDVTLRGSYDFPAELMTQKGTDALTALLKTSPPENAEQRREMLTELLDFHGRPESLEEEIDLPGWPQELMDALSEQYDADLVRIAEIDGVTLLTP